MLTRFAPATESLQTTIIQEKEEMLLRLGISQMVAQKLVDNQGSDSPCYLASLFDEDITAICDVIKRPSGSVSCKTPER